LTIAAAHLYAGRDEAALAWAKRAVAARPGAGIPHAWVAAAAANLGDTATARAALAEFRRLQPDQTLASFRAERHGDSAEFLRQREYFYQGLSKAGLVE
jgi:adenylate cyclase